MCHLATDHGFLVDAMKDEKEVDLSHVRINLLIRLWDVVVVINLSHVRINQLIG